MEDHSNKIYLGDGAYAIFTGYSIELAANHHENIVLELELSAVEELFEWTKSQIKNQVKD